MGNSRSDTLILLLEPPNPEAYDEGFELLSVEVQDPPAPPPGIEIPTLKREDVLSLALCETPSSESEGLENEEWLREEIRVRGSIEELLWHESPPVEPEDRRQDSLIPIVPLGKHLRVEGHLWGWSGYSWCQSDQDWDSDSGFEIHSTQVVDKITNH